jgi:threonine dehydrogenase-like Zn-dependent dehydrogenase
MKTRAVRLHGKNKLLLDVIELPPLGNREIRAKIITNSLCFSTYKTWQQGETHKKTPDDLKKNPVIVGHEFAGIIEEVGKDLKGLYLKGDFFAIQPAIYYNGPIFVPGGIYGAVGYSFQFCGGNAQDIIIPQPVIDSGVAITFKNCAFFEASLAEPLSCIIGAANEEYHTTIGEHRHIMGIKEGGNLAILGAGGPMGIGMIDYFLHGDRKPSFIMATEIDDEKLNRAKKLFSDEKSSVKLVFINPKKENIFSKAKKLTEEKLFDDIFTLFPSRELIETADKLLGENGTHNFFAGPSEKELSAEINFYHIHYSHHKHLGTSGGNIEDLKEVLKLLGNKKLNPAQMVSVVGGLDSVIGAIENFPYLPPGKKMIYTGVKMPLVELSELKKLSKNENTTPVYKKIYKDLDNIISNNKGLWCKEAEEYIMNRKEISFRL